MAKKGKQRRKADYYLIKAICVLRKNDFSFYMIKKLLGFKDKRNLLYYYKKHKDEFLLPEEEQLKVGNNNNIKKEK